MTESQTERTAKSWTQYTAESLTGPSSRMLCSWPGGGVDRHLRCISKMGLRSTSHAAQYLATVRLHIRTDTPETATTSTPDSLRKEEDVDSLVASSPGQEADADTDAGSA